MVATRSSSSATPRRGRSRTRDRTSPARGKKKAVTRAENHAAVAAPSRAHASVGLRAAPVANRADPRIGERFLATLVTNSLHSFSANVIFMGGGKAAAWLGLPSGMPWAHIAFGLELFIGSFFFHRLAVMNPIDCLANALIGGRAAAVVATSNAIAIQLAYGVGIFAAHAVLPDEFAADKAEFGSELTGVPISVLCLSEAASTMALVVLLGRTPRLLTGAALSAANATIIVLLILLTSSAKMGNMNPAVVLCNHLYIEGARGVDLFCREMLVLFWAPFLAPLLIILNVGGGSAPDKTQAETIDEEHKKTK